VPLLVDSEHPDHVKQLESWMKSYRPRSCSIKMAAHPENWPSSPRRATGGWVPIRTPTADFYWRDLRMPDFHVHAVNVPSPGAVDGQDTLVLGKFLRDVTKLNQDQRNFRVFGPDETVSNLLGRGF